ncbi:MAG TPA: quinolinate synthase NadA [Vicinamibacterales bacterium]|nr:quinolinate synthase NadA [Vicinamibacterales bacterium]
MSSIIPLLTEYETQHLSERQALPEKYLGLSDEEMTLRIADARRVLGDRLVILGHHYQRDEVIRFADYTGDSFRLARQIAQRPEADFIVFCGVHFMAESADVLCAPNQQVILPDLAAGCSMADMATPEQLETCWEELTQMGITPRQGSGQAGVVPVTYINSAASIKAFVGERGGTVCTSSNAMATLKWGFAHGEKILFLPDQHLGRNTAYKMGIALDEMVVWDPNEIFGGLQPEQVQRAKMILWKGHCSVHERFTAKQIETVRRQHPGIRVIVHPEVPWDVVQAADDSGSTEYIIKTVSNSPDGSVWAVGTEVHLVNRLAQQMAPAKTVISLDQFGCLCSTMFRVSPNHLLWILDELVEGRVHNQIVVPDDQKHWNRVALERMLSIS